MASHPTPAHPSRISDLDPNPDPLLDVDDLDDRCVADAVQRHDRVALGAVVHALGVLDGGRQDLVRRVAVGGARRALCQDRDEAARDERLARGRLAAAGPREAVCGVGRVGFSGVGVGFSVGGGQGLGGVQVHVRLSVGWVGGVGTRGGVCVRVRLRARTCGPVSAP